MTVNVKEIGVSTTMMIVLFGANLMLCIFFQLISRHERKTVAHDSTVDAANSHKKELSKPFTLTVEGFTNLTFDMAKLGFIMALTYICEYHWIYPHSGKEYNRDLFLFIILIFFLYGIYTIKPTKDLTLLSRDQTEEWKGWMQFIFLLYHCKYIYICNSSLCKLIINIIHIRFPC